MYNFYYTYRYDRIHPSLTKPAIVFHSSNKIILSLNHRFQKRDIQKRFCTLQFEYRSQKFIKIKLQLSNPGVGSCTYTLSYDRVRPSYLRQSEFAGTLKLQGNYWTLRNGTARTADLSILHSHWPAVYLVK